MGDNKFNPFGLISDLAGPLINTGLGLALEGHNDRRQLRQQQKLQDMQIQGNMEMGDYNYAKQFDMWERTQYAGQKEQMEKAGLNPALMYGMGGGGGTTTGSGGGAVSGAQAPSGGREIMDNIGMGLQLALQKAQIDNIKADTTKKGAETTNIGKQTEQIGQNIENLWQANENQKWSYELLKIDRGLKMLDLYAKEQTIDDSIQTVKKNLEIIKNNAEISQSTKDEIIKAAELDLIGKGLQNINTQATTKKTEAEIANMAARLINETRSLDQKDTEIKIRQQLADWDTNITREVVGKVINLVGAVKGFGGGGTTTTTYENTRTDKHGNVLTSEGSTSTKRN